MAAVGILIAPSILSADFADLAAELDRIGTADFAHVDVMDNHFVPNLTLGLPIVERLAAVSPIPLDVHLMIEDPDRWAPAYAEAGAASVTFHAEAATAPVRLARELRRLGARAGLALRPATPVEPYLDLLGELDMVLVMTVEPGLRRPGLPRRHPAEDPPGPPGGRGRRAGRLGPGRRRDLGGDDRAGGRGGRERLRRRVGRLRRRGPPRRRSPSSGRWPRGPTSTPPRLWHTDPQNTHVLRGR